MACVRGTDGQWADAVGVGRWGRGVGWPGHGGVGGLGGTRTTGLGSVRAACSGGGGRRRGLVWERDAADLCRAGPAGGDRETARGRHSGPPRGFAAPRGWSARRDGEREVTRWGPVEGKHSWWLLAGPATNPSPYFSVHQSFVGVGKASTFSGRSRIRNAVPVQKIGLPIFGLDYREMSAMDHLVSEVT